MSLEITAHNIQYDKQKHFHRDAQTIQQLNAAPFQKSALEHKSL